MSPWTIYWILQLDAIHEALLIVSTISVMIVVVTGAFGALFSVESGMTDLSKVLLKLFKRTLIVFVIAGFGAIFLPNTKTMCAVLTIPAIVNNEVLQGDAVDIYKLGMERVKELLGKEESE